MVSFAPGAHWLPQTSAALVPVACAASIVGLLAVLVVAWLRREQTNRAVAGAIMLTMAGAIWWCACTLTISVATDPGLINTSHSASVLGMYIAAAGYYLTARCLTDSRYSRTVTVLAVLMSVPVAYLGLWAVPSTRPLLLGTVVLRDGAHWWTAPSSYWLMVGRSCAATSSGLSSPSSAGSCRWR